MSVPVALAELRAALAERPSAAYLLTVSDDGRPHAVHVALAWDGDRLAAEVGRRTAANAAARPGVSLVFPLRTPDDYSLIVDGTAALAGASPSDDARRLLIAPTKAVLHRAAATPDASSACGSDCVPLVDPSPRTRD